VWPDFRILSASLLFVGPAMAQTTLTKAGLVTTNGAGDQAALCYPSNGTYPQQWTWDPSKTIGVDRDATLSDNLTPRIEQRRIINGKNVTVAVWGSLNSNPYTCQEIFQSVPPQPVAGQPFTAAQYQPYTPAQLQTMANQGCGPFGNVSHVGDLRRWQSGDTFLIYPAVYTSTSTKDGIISNNNITLKPLPDYYNGNKVPIYSPNNITIRGVTVNGVRPTILRNDNGGGDSESSKDVVEISGGANKTIENATIILGPQGYVLQAGVYLIHLGYDDYDQYGNALAVPALGSGTNTTTFSHLHISGFQQVESVLGGANGVTGSPDSGGVLKTDGMPKLKGGVARLRL